jgi:hypothetical protein
MIAYKLDKQISGEKLLKDIDKMIQGHKGSKDSMILFIEIRSVNYEDHSLIPKLEYKKDS